MSKFISLDNLTRYNTNVKEYIETKTSGGTAEAKAYTDEQIAALDVNDITGFGQNKTLENLTETDGKIFASFQEIKITSDEITDKTDTYEAEGTTVVTGKSITAALDTLDFEELSLSQAEAIKSISQTNGKIIVEKQAIQITENQVNNLVDDLAAKATKTTTIAGIDLQDNITEAELRTALEINNVDNTSDVTKPVSTAQATAIADAKSEAISTAADDATTKANAAKTYAEGLVTAEATARNTAITNAINALDVNLVGGDGSYLKTISETDGKITAVAQAFDTTFTSASDNNIPTTKAVQDFVNSSIEASAARYITYNTAGDPFPTKSALSSATVFYYNGTTVVPTANDYLIILKDESKIDPQTSEEPTTRYLYTGSQWNFQYVVNSTGFTVAQWAAVNSGVTSNKCSSYDSHLTDNSNPHSVTKEQVELGNVINKGMDSAPTEGSENYVQSGGTYSAIANKVTKNADITASTKCKITYDEKGLVTAGEDLAVSDLPTHTHTITQITDFPTNLVYTDSAQDISATKTFTDTAKVAFKPQDNTNISISATADTYSDTLKITSGNTTGTKVGSTELQVFYNYNTGRKIIMPATDGDVELGRTGNQFKNIFVSGYLKDGDTTGSHSISVAEIAAKQDALTTDQLAAANSGITAAKVSTYDNYSIGKQDKLTVNPTTTSDTLTSITIDNTSYKIAAEPEEYLKSASVSSNTLTLINKDSTSIEFTPTFTNTWTLTNTVGSEAVSDGTNALNIMTRDTTQTISGTKVFDDITIKTVNTTPVGIQFWLGTEEELPETKLDSVIYFVKES